MPNIDLPLDELWSYSPTETEPTDFDEFWAGTLEQARSDNRAGGGFGLGEPYMPLAGVEANRAWITGLGGDRISGWYVRPAAGGPFPGVVHFHGYAGRGARPLELYALAAQGVAVLSMDCRGQGGDAPDAPTYGGHYPGWLTRGLEGPGSHYYRYVFADAVIALEALCALEEVDESRVAVTGMSQGGGLALAAASLSGRVSFVWADEPFLCDFPRAVEITPTSPYTEVSTYLKRRPDLAEAAFRTLAYIDVANHARRLSCPARVSVGLWDQICPPSTVFGTFRRLASEDKELIVLPYHGHELTYELEEQRFKELLARLGPKSPA